MAFRIGQKVVCVDANYNENDRLFNEVLPRKGEVYTIREFYDTDCLRVEEIINQPHQYRFDYAEAAFWKWRFRAVTDISVLTKLLTKLPELV